MLNSISALRPEMFELAAVRPFRPILLVSEHVKDGRAEACRTAEETYQAAKDLVAAARASGRGSPTTTTSSTRASRRWAAIPRATSSGCSGALGLIHADADFAGCHASVGLSNFTVMLPPKRANGEPVKGPLESAFLTRAMPLGLDMVIGSVKRKYEILPPDHPAMLCLDAVLAADGFEGIMRVREFLWEK